MVGGKFRAVHLINATAEVIEDLEPNGCPEAASWGVERILSAMAIRHRKRLWGK